MQLMIKVCLFDRQYDNLESHLMSEFSRSFSSSFFAPSRSPRRCSARRRGPQCGAQKRHAQRPGLNLGYPFDRPAPTGTLALVESAGNMALRKLVIRHDAGLAEEFGLGVGS
jgi:hypothetical protein